MYHTAKVVLLGDSGVGKSSVINRAINDSFYEYAESSISAAFVTMEKVIDNETIKLEIWDTAGQERYKALAPIYFKNSKVAMIFYSITNIKSFNAAKSWMKTIEDHNQGKTKMILVGNKCDLVNKREVTYKQGEELADKNGVLFFETSAKNKQNILSLFNCAYENLTFNEDDCLEKDSIRSFDSNDPSNCMCY